MKLRIQRVCELLKRELGVLLVREVRFSSPLVTISGVDMTPDLKQAHIFVSVLGSDADQRDALEQLDQNRKMLQQELMKRITLKHTPLLHFKLDRSIERGTRIIAIMDELGLEDQTGKAEDDWEEDEDYDDQDDRREDR